MKKLLLTGALVLSAGNLFGAASSEVEYPFDAMDNWRKNADLKNGILMGPSTELHHAVLGWLDWLEEKVTNEEDKKTVRKLVEDYENRTMSDDPKDYASFLDLKRSPLYETIRKNAGIK